MTEPKFDVSIILMDDTVLKLPRVDLETALRLSKEIVSNGYSGRPRYKKKPVTITPDQIKEVTIQQVG